MCLSWDLTWDHTLSDVFYIREQISSNILIRPPTLTQVPNLWLKQTLDPFMLITLVWLFQYISTKTKMNRKYSNFSWMQNPRKFHVTNASYLMRKKPEFSLEAKKNHIKITKLLQMIKNCFLKYNAKLFRLLVFTLCKSSNLIFPSNLFGLSSIDLRNIMHRSINCKRWQIAAILKFEK